MPSRAKTTSTSRREWNQAARDKINSTRIVKRFLNHFEGEAELTRDQIKVGEILLRKTLPDLTATDLTTKGDSVSFTMNIGKPKK